MPAQIKRIGFIGVGTMGRMMTRNLLRRHFPATVYDRDPATIDALLEDGAEPAESSTHCARNADVVITMLPSSPDVDAAVLGPDGALAGMRPGTVLIDMSTIDPLESR